MPGFKTFASGDVLTAADVNDYLMEQAVIQCTSGTRPSSPHEGMSIVQTDTNAFAIWNGSAWVEFGRWGAWDTFTPTVTQAGSPVLFTNTVSRYCRIGTLVHVRCVLAITGAGTSAEVIVGNLPVAAGDVEYIGGNFEILDAGNAYFVGTVRGNTTTSVKFVSHLEGAFVGSDPAFALASGDEIRFTLTYESA